MKKSELIFGILLLPIDILMIVASFIFAYDLRSQMDVIYIWSFQEYIRFVLILIPFWLLIFAVSGLYNIRNKKKPLDEFASIILGVSSGIMLLVGWLFLSRTIFFSRLVVVYAWFIAMFLVSFGRVSVRMLQNYLLRLGVGVHRLIIVGENGATPLILKEIQANKNLGYKLIGIVQTKDEDKINNTKILGHINDFDEIINKYKVDDVILADANLAEKSIVRIMDSCHDKKILFKQVPNLFQVQTTNVNVTSLATVPIIEFQVTPLDGWGRIFKRLMDLVLSSILIIFTSPIMLIAAILIRLDSKGPIFYKNERVGENGKNFFVYKFRTMKIEFCTGNSYGGKNAESFEKKLVTEKNERVGPVYKVLHDPRRTKIGRILERTSIDEFPQFFNVFLGKMSMVGPRPHQPREVANYKQWHKKVLRIKPGITGMAQVSGRSDLDFDDEARLDIYYIENWSTWLDIKIVLKTPWAMIAPRKTV